MNSVHLTRGVLDVDIALVQRIREINAAFVVGFFDDSAKLLHRYVFLFSIPVA